MHKIRKRWFSNRLELSENVIRKCLIRSGLLVPSQKSRFLISFSNSIIRSALIAYDNSAIASKIAGAISLEHKLLLLLAQGPRSSQKQMASTLLYHCRFLFVLISDSRFDWFGSVYLVTTAGFVADQLM